MIELSLHSKNPVVAIQCLWQGVQLLGRRELRPFLIWPIVINIALYAIVLWLGYLYLADLMAHFIPEWLSWLEWILWPLFLLSFLMTGFFTFTVLANLIAAPFYSHLSARTWALLAGAETVVAEQPVTQVLWAEAQRAGYTLSRMLPLLILFIIPLLNVLAPIVWALFGAWSMALEFMGYPLENKGVLFAEQKALLKSARLSSIGFGGVVVLGLSIPLLNLIVSPAAVIGATVYIFRATEQE